MYDKGAIALYQLNEKIGDKKFLNFLLKAGCSKIKDNRPIIGFIRAKEQRFLEYILICKKGESA